MPSQKGARIMLKRKLHDYVSDADQFLKNFDKAHPEKSASQQAEIAKHEKLGKLRDEVNELSDDEQIWDEF